MGERVEWCLDVDLAELFHHFLTRHRFQDLVSVESVRVDNYHIAVLCNLKHELMLSIPPWLNFLLQFSLLLFKLLRRLLFRLLLRLLLGLFWLSRFYLFIYFLFFVR